jgi:signal transduction histidine kinase
VDVKVSENIPSFESDRGKLEQILFNLFNNAIGNMKDGGHLEITAQREDTQAISIAFCNNGPGISEPDLKHVFDPFFFSKPGESRTGIGLSVTYALVQEIGGTIRVESQIGKGTRFTIELPIKVTETKQRDQANSPSNIDHTELDHA